MAIEHKARLLQEPAVQPLPGNRSNLNLGRVRMQWVQEKVAGPGNKGRGDLQKRSGIPVQPLITQRPRCRLLPRPALRQLRPIIQLFDRDIVRHMNFKKLVKTRQMAFFNLQVDKDFQKG